MKTISAKHLHLLQVGSVRRLQLQVAANLLALETRQYQARKGHKHPHPQPSQPFRRYLRARPVAERKSVFYFLFPYCHKDTTFSRTTAQSDKKNKKKM